MTKCPSKKELKNFAKSSEQGKGAIETVELIAKGFGFDSDEIIEKEVKVKCEMIKGIPCVSIILKAIYD